MNEKYKLRLGAVVGASYTSPWDDVSTIMSVSDTLVIERVRTDSRTQFTLFVVAERQFRQSIFSVSADLLISYLQKIDGYYSKETRLNSNNEWKEITANWDLNNGLTSNRRTYYLNPGMQLKFAINLPIRERFILHGSIGQILSLPIHLNESLTNDPFNEFNAQENIFTFSSQSQANIGLRYIFKAN